MMRSLNTGLIGVKTHQTKMDVIGNNISNVNTTGFKTGRATFADVLSQSIKGATASNGEMGSTNPMQVGLGGNVSAVDTIFKDGAPMVTGKNTDLCLSGDALFVVRQGAETYYTRNGAFNFDEAGDYVLPGSGHHVQGWMANNGVIDTTGALGNINVQLGKAIAAQPTDSVSYYDNLNAGVPTVTNIVEGEGGPATAMLSDGTSVVDTEGNYKVGNSLPVATAVTVYDSLGATHEVPVYFIHEGELNDGATPSRWLVSLSPDASVTKGETTTAEFTDENGEKMTASLNVAEIQFDSSGNLVTDSDTDTTGTMNLAFEPGSGGTAPANQNVTVDFKNLTQFAGNNTIHSSGNGNVSGVLEEIQVDSSGRITGIYTNGVRRPEAQVALAHFNNSPGLTKTGTGLYLESENSGTPGIIEAGEFGVAITPGALEMSNVDVANEFSEMIITQRGFQSNAKVITVGDGMIETAVNLKR